MQDKLKIGQQPAGVSKKRKKTPAPAISKDRKPAGDIPQIGFTDLFDLSEIQALQDNFSEAMGVASVITDNMGNAITHPTGFSKHLNAVPRLDGMTFVNCMCPSIIGPQIMKESPLIEQCSECGLLFGMAAINAGDKRIANWIVGQVIDEGTDMETVLSATQKMGIDREEFRRALEGVPRMTRERFEKICTAIALMAKQLSLLAIQNIQQARDITELRRVEEALKSSELRYRQMFSNNPFPCLLYDLETLEIVDANDSAVDYYGYSREELLSITLKDIRPPEEIPKLLEYLAGPKLYPPKDPWLHKKKDGTITTVEVIGHALDFPGKHYRVINVIDITERKRTEERLLFTQFAVDRAAAIILWIGEDSRMLYANDEAYRCLGYTREEFLSLKVPDFDPNFSASNWKKHWESVKRKGTTIFESVQKRKDGSLCPVEINGNYMEFNGVGYICSICFDITDRKKTEELLNMTRFSVDQSSIPTFWLSTDGNAIHVNKAACRSLGYTEAEIIGMNVTAWDEGFPHYRWNKAGKRSKSQHSMTMESMHKRKDGTRFPVELNLNYMEYGGNEYIFAFALNISERKRAEEEKEKLQAQLLQSQKMEAIGQLAGGVAHDFNNILTALIGYGNLLEMEMPEDDPLRAYVEQILDSSEKAANLTQSLLAFSRKQKINLKYHNINDIIYGVEKLLKRLLSEDIDLRISNTSHDVPILADNTQIEQVLINLATNARDAMPAGGTLSIEVKCIDLDDSFIKVQGYEKPAQYAMISVSDTGVGMDKKTQERIFEPFFTTKEVGKGTGLGLSTVYGIIQQHSGFISTYSEVGVGTTFHIYLPAVDGKAEKKRKEPPVIKSGSGTILLAEDNPDVRRLAREVLVRTGYNVIESSDGQEAIDTFIANQDRVDLIIVDVVMPKRNGKEVYDVIKAIKPDVKVLFTSGYTRDIIFDKGLYDTSVNFLAKPLSPQELLQKIYELMSSET